MRMSLNFKFLWIRLLRNLLKYFRALTIWKILAILFALLNLKSLPGSWHIRIFSAFIRHILFPSYSLSLLTPAALFRPLIMTSHAPLLECDYNVHKSNSTYFLDFDQARMHLCAGLLASGMRKASQELGFRVSIMLGGVSCNFKREIKPYQRFEVWSRILCWDRKWLYTISHFVRKGAVGRPKRGEETLNVRSWWKGGKGRKTEKRNESEKIGHNKNGGEAGNGESATSMSPPPAPHPAIFASAIAKYVFKQGRITIHPEKILQNSNLLPPKPPQYSSLSSSTTSPPPTSSASPTTSEETASAEGLRGLSLKTADEVMDASLTASAGSENDEWDWDRIEAERERGMAIAELYAGLEALNQEFEYEGKPVLGEVMLGGWAGIR